MDSRITEMIRNEIIMHAKRRRTIDYEMIRLVIGQSKLDIVEIDNYLTGISNADHAEGKPILWSLVNMESGLPSENFFLLLERLKLVEVRANLVTRMVAYSKLKEEAFVYWSTRRRSGGKKPKRQV